MPKIKHGDAPVARTELIHGILKPLHVACRQVRSGQRAALRQRAQFLGPHQEWFPGPQGKDAFLTRGRRQGDVADP